MRLLIDDEDSYLGGQEEKDYDLTQVALGMTSFNNPSLDEVADRAPPGRYVHIRDQEFRAIFGSNPASPGCRG